MTRTEMNADLVAHLPAIPGTQALKSHCVSFAAQTEEHFLRLVGCVRLFVVV